MLLCLYPVPARKLHVGLLGIGYWPGWWIPWSLGFIPSLICTFPLLLCSGRSEGSAEVIFANKIDAERAMKRYNNVQLDGQPMQVRTMHFVSCGLTDKCDMVCQPLLQWLCFPTHAHERAQWNVWSAS